MLHFVYHSLSIIPFLMIKLNQKIVGQLFKITNLNSKERKRNIRGKFTRRRRNEKCAQRGELDRFTSTSIIESSWYRRITEVCTEIGVPFHLCSFVRSLCLPKKGKKRKRKKEKTARQPYRIAERGRNQFRRGKVRAFYASAEKVGQRAEPNDLARFPR